MTVEDLFSVQRDQNKLQSLYMELARHEDFNPYKNNVISDMPKGGSSGKNINEWYAEEKERIERQIDFYQQKLQEDRRMVDEYINAAPYPECDIIRFRVINGMPWKDIGDIVGYSGRNVARKFWNYIDLSKMSKMSNEVL